MSSVLEAGFTLPRGRHVCAFYSAKSDLLEFLAPYFAAGVANRESCVWVVPESVTRDEAVNSAEGVARKMGLRFSGDCLEVVSFRDWYLEDGLFQPGRVKRAWKNRLAAAVAKGGRCLRVTGDTSWVAQEDWSTFIRYENDINREFAAEPFVAVCTYILHRTPQHRMDQVLANHHFGVVKQHGEWSLIPRLP